MSILLFIAGLLFIQDRPVPQFRDAAVIPAFKRADPTLTSFYTFYKQPIDAAHNLLVVRGTPRRSDFAARDHLYWNVSDLIGVFLMDRTDPTRVWEIAMLTEAKYETDLRVERADSNSIVFSRAYEDYGGPVDSIKLFFDTGSKRLVKRIDYPSDTGVAHVIQVNDTLCVGANVTRTPLVACVMDSRLSAVSAPEISNQLQGRTIPIAQPADLPDKNDLPQSTYAEFARARPGRIRDGYRERGTSIEEQIGVSYVVGDRTWFGKTFYDGEGISGVGGIGYVDKGIRKYTIIRTPELADWSTSALSVEGNIAWIGLVTFPEGASRSGGLLQLDLKSRRTRKYPINDIVFSITRWKEALYLGTTNGLYVLRGMTLTRYHFEPDINGNIIVVSEDVSI